MAQTSRVLPWVVVATTVFVLIKCEGERSVWRVYGLHGDLAIVGVLEVAAASLGHPVQGSV